MVFYFIKNNHQGNNRNINAKLFIMFTFTSVNILEKLLEQHKHIPRNV